MRCISNDNDLYVGLNKQKYINYLETSYSIPKWQASDKGFGKRDKPRKAVLQSSFTPEELRTQGRGCCTHSAWHGKCSHLHLRQCRKDFIFTVSREAERSHEACSEQFSEFTGAILKPGQLAFFFFFANGNGKNNNWVTQCHWEYVFREGK